MMNLYLVEEGAATALVTPTHAVEIPDVDGENSILVFASNEAEALKAAASYDDGAAQPDNIRLWTGDVVSALIVRDGHPDYPLSKTYEAEQRKQQA